MPTPQSISRADMMTALEPLGDLLGVDLRDTFIPIVIGHESITFSVSPTKRLVVDQSAPRGAGDALGVVATLYSVEVR